MIISWIDYAKMELSGGGSDAGKEKEEDNQQGRGEMKSREGSDKRVLSVLSNIHISFCK